MADRLPRADIQQRFLDSIGSAAMISADTDAAGELVVELQPPLPRRVRVYVYNATNPSGGRSGREHKIQLTRVGRREGAPANFDWSGVDLVLLCGYVTEHDVFVFWDANLRRDFAYSTNLQVPSEKVVGAASTGVIVVHERPLRRAVGAARTIETIICAPRQSVKDAIAERLVGPLISPLPASTAPTSGRPYTKPPRIGDGEAALRVFRVDPDVIDRGTNAHKDIQDELADAVTGRGWQPLSPSGTDPLFDVGWIVSDTAWIAEVKSLTDSNEDSQLRLGLGQVLSYAHLVDWHDLANRPVLAVEREPTAAYWPDLCDSHGVSLTWPATFDAFLDTCA